MPKWSGRKSPPLPLLIHEGRGHGGYCSCVLDNIHVVFKAEHPLQVLLTAFADYSVGIIRKRLKSFFETPETRVFCCQLAVFLARGRNGGHGGTMLVSVADSRRPGYAAFLGF